MNKGPQSLMQKDGTTDMYQLVFYLFSKDVANYGRELIPPKEIASHSYALIKTYYFYIIAQSSLCEL